MQHMGMAAYTREGDALRYALHMTIAKPASPAAA
jgi:hypothetical protein